MMSMSKNKSMISSCGGIGVTVPLFLIFHPLHDMCRQIFPNYMAPKRALAKDSPLGRIKEQRQALKIANRNVDA
jgi:hypothetical protein